MTPAESVFKVLWPDRCWHRWGVDNKGYSQCMRCLGYVEDITHLDENPDYSTSSGFFTLKAECEKGEWWDSFWIWWLRKYMKPSAKPPSPERIVHAANELYESPLTFLTAIHEFFKEKGWCE